MEGPNPIDLTQGVFRMASPPPRYSEEITRKWGSLIVIANPHELRRAREAGWTTSNIILPKAQYIEGRRWRRLVMTWAFLDENADSPMMERIHSDQVIYDLPVRISDVMNEERIWR